MQRWLTVACFAAATLVVGACEERESAPRADLRDEGGTPTIPTNPNPDAAIAADAMAEDAGAGDAQLEAGSDAALAYQCLEVSSPDPNNRLAASEVGSGNAVTFDTAFAFAQWDRVCNPPRLLVGLAEESCTLDVGGQLVFSLDEQALGTSLTVGGNQIEVAQFEDRISVWFRYEVADATYTWGNCEGSFGSLLIEDIGPRTGDRITASFDLTLTDCSAPQQLIPINLTGNIDITVPDYERVCL